MRTAPMLALAGLGLVSLSGCMMAGNYHTAKPLGKGISSFGLTFSANHYMFDYANVPNFTIPNLLPELTYHVGVTDDLDLGGRVSLGALGLEVDAKYRVFESGGLHLALAPAATFQTFVLLNGGGVRLPLVATIDLNETFGLTAAAFGTFTRYTMTEMGLDDADGLGSLGGNTMSYGVAFTPDIRGETFFFRPGIEWMRYQAKLGATVGGTTASTSFRPFNALSVSVHFGFIFGREKQQLDRIEQKVDDGFDKLNEKLDGRGG